MPRSKKSKSISADTGDSPSVEMCTLDETTSRVVRACSKWNSSFHIGEDNVCQQSVIYKNDLERYLYTDEIPARVFAETERDLKELITAAVCNPEIGGQFVNWLDSKIRLDCSIVPDSCDRFQREMIGSLARIIDKYEGIRVGGL